MGRIKFESLNPWAESLVVLLKEAKAVDNFLLSGPLGSDLVHCLGQFQKQIGGSSRIVDCTSDTRVFIQRLKGKRSLAAETYVDDYEEVDAISSQIHLSGMVILWDIHHCNTTTLSFLSRLIRNKEAEIDSIHIQIDPNTLIVGAFTEIGDTINPSVIQIFAQHIVIPGLAANSRAIISKLVWFMNEQDSGIAAIELEVEAVESLSNYEWPGDRRELREIALLILNDYSPGKIISSEECRQILVSKTRKGFIDRSRQLQVDKLVTDKDVMFRGKTYSWKNAYDWILQFLNIEDDEQHSWDIGYVIVSEVIKNYYFNENSVSKFISSACDEFVDVCNTSSNIILLIPETGIKSNQSISRKAYLYIKGRLSIRQILLSEISGAFIGTDITIICADDFAGTGSQVIETIIQPIKELISSHGAPINVSLFFIFAVAYQQALDNIVSQSTAAINISTFCGLVLSNKDKAFHSESGIFSNRDMRTRARHLLSSVIGTCLNPMSPEGFGDLQSLIVFSDNVPDNTLPAISSFGMVKGFIWKPLFSRVDTS